MNIIVALNNIRSSENVGSIFRTCDAAGVSKIILIGITPAPNDRFNRENKNLTKASLGAEKSVEWKKFVSLKEAIANMHKSFSDSKNLTVVAIEQDKSAINYRALKKAVKNVSNLILVFGNEVDGLSKKDLGLCDIIAEIPMRGKKESLNVATSAGIILYEIVP